MLRGIRCCVVGLVVSLTGCATIDPFAESSSPSAPPPDVFTNHFNEADVAFANAMVAHEQVGLALAAIALDPSRNVGEEVVRIAQHMVDEGGERIERFSGLLDDWNQRGEQQTSQIGRTELNRLEPLSGSDFDRQWVDIVVAHHHLALTLIDSIQLDGASRDINNSASGIRADIDFDIGRLETVAQT